MGIMHRLDNPYLDTVAWLLTWHAAEEAKKSFEFTDVVAAADLGQRNNDSVKHFRGGIHPLIRPHGSLSLCGCSGRPAGPWLSSGCMCVKTIMVMWISHVGEFKLDAISNVQMKRYITSGSDRRAEQTLWERRGMCRKQMFDPFKMLKHFLQWSSQCW